MKSIQSRSPHLHYLARQTLPNGIRPSPEAQVHILANAHPPGSPHFQDPAPQCWYAGPVLGLHSLEHAPNACDVLGRVLQVWTSRGVACSTVDGSDTGGVEVGDGDRLWIPLYSIFHEDICIFTYIHLSNAGIYFLITFLGLYFHILELMLICVSVFRKLVHICLSLS